MLQSIIRAYFVIFMVFTFQNSRRRIKPLPTKTVLVAEGNCCWDVYSRPGYRVRIVTRIK